MPYECDDAEVELRTVSERRRVRNQQDTTLLVNSWRAIALSHRLLDREIFRLASGELHIVEDPGARLASGGKRGHV